MAVANVGGSLGVDGSLVRRGGAGMTVAVTAVVVDEAV